METKVITEKTVDSEKGTILFAKTIAPMIKTGDTILLYGALGSGKTFLIREIVKNLGMQDVVSSPSFSLINQYYGKDFIINHVDLYRINGENELANLGLEDFWQKPYINLIEWPQIIAPIIDWAHYRIEIETTGRSTTWRRFSFKNVNPGN